jgi:RNA polymerase sigma-70 factor (ECF subfamily)
MTEPDPESFEETRSLIEASQAGDGAARERLFTRYLPRVRQAVALRMGRRLRQLAELDDVVQEVFIRVLEGLERFEHRSEGSFRNWLARCVQREVADHARSLGRKKRGAGMVRRFGDFESGVLASSIFEGSEPTPSDFAGATELAEKIEDALLSMPQHHREIIVLRAVLGMSYDEIAREIGVSRAGAVRVAYLRATRNLKDLMGH